MQVNNAIQPQSRALPQKQKFVPVPGSDFTVYLLAMLQPNRFNITLGRLAPRTEQRSSEDNIFHESRANIKSAAPEGSCVRQSGREYLTGQKRHVPGTEESLPGEKITQRSLTCSEEKQALVFKFDGTTSDGRKLQTVDGRQEVKAALSEGLNKANSISAGLKAEKGSTEEKVKKGSNNSPAAGQALKTAVEGLDRGNVAGLKKMAAKLNLIKLDETCQTVAKGEIKNGTGMVQAGVSKQHLETAGQELKPAGSAGILPGQTGKPTGAEENATARFVEKVLVTENRSQAAGFARQGQQVHVDPGGKAFSPVTVANMTAQGQESSGAQPAIQKEAGKTVAGIFGNSEEGQAGFVSYLSGTARRGTGLGQAVSNYRAVVNGVLETARLVRTGKMEELEVQLKPEKLGRLKIRAALENGHLTVQMLVENGESARSLQSMLPEIRQAIVQQGFKMVQVQVAVGDGGYGSDIDKNPDGRGESRQGQDKGYHVQNMQELTNDRPKGGRLYRLNYLA